MNRMVVIEANIAWKSVSPASHRFDFFVTHGHATACISAHRMLFSVCVFSFLILFFCVSIHSSRSGSVSSVRQMWHCTVWDLYQRHNRFSGDSFSLFLFVLWYDFTLSNTWSIDFERIIEWNDFVLLAPVSSWLQRMQCNRIWNMQSVSRLISLLIIWTGKCDPNHFYECWSICRPFEKY